MPVATKSIYSALAANLLIAVTKFIAGGVTKSSAMIAEGIHSLVDTANEMLLLLGIKRSRKEPDRAHPFGYGRELYFWSFIVSMLIFGLGGCISIYQGYVHIRSPHPLENPLWNYVVLVLSIVFEGASFLVAMKEFNMSRGDQSWWTAIVNSKDPTRFMVLFEDGAAVLGLFVVLICLLLGHRFNIPWLDGLASLIIGVILVVVSLLLARESKSLLMGEGISKITRNNIIKMTEKDAAVSKVTYVFSRYEAPDEVLLLLNIAFRSELTTNEINKAIERIRGNIQNEYSLIQYIFVQPEIAD